MSGAMTLPPVIAIDGPTASGKGTVAQRVARILSFHYLDSGALYRLVALASSQAGVAWSDEAALARVAATLDVRFEGNEIYLKQSVVTDSLRSEEISAGSSKVAVWPAVRAALLKRQRAFRVPPGLVADGRDMGSVVFADAELKIYLTADAETRAERRYKQLIGKGMDANITTLLQDIRQRDERDSARAIAPLQKNNDASFLDTTGIAIDEVVAEVVARYATLKRLP
jgi:cytidylate kinase